MTQVNCTRQITLHIPLRVIRELSRHRNLEELQKYLEVRPEQVTEAVSALSMLSYSGKYSYDDVETDLSLGLSPVEKCAYDDVETDFLEPPQVDDLEASDNGGIYL